MQSSCSSCNTAAADQTQPLDTGTGTGTGSYLGVEAAGGLQEQRQVGLDLAAVRVGPVLGLALQRGDLVLEGVVPPAATANQKGQRSPEDRDKPEDGEVCFIPEGK